MSKLVDPASTLITRGAARLFSSVFRKRLEAPPGDESPVASFETRQAAADVCDNNPLPETQKRQSKCKDDSRNHSNGAGVSELERLLKEKTFTRAEYDHLMELLHSRTVDVSKEEENKIIEASTLLPASDCKKQGDVNLPPQENGIGSSKFIGIASTFRPTMKITEEEFSSPAEVAKAYMGSRPSKVSPSSLCLRSQILREATSSPSFIGFAPKSSAAPVCSKTVVCFSGIPGTFEDGCMTSRFRGRSAIYKMSRSPYLKGQPTITLKDGELTEGGYPGPSMSSQTPRNIALSSGKEVLKRRSSVLDSDLGSIGPIRRIRQKSNLVSSADDVISEFPVKLLPAANALDIVQRSSSIQRPLPLREHKYVTPKMKLAENQEERRGCASVPLQSKEMAEKILQQLDKLVPSPKVESTEAKTISRDELPPKLLDMLHGQASKSLTKMDAPELFNVGANGELEGSNNFHPAGPKSSVSPTKGKVENGHSKPTFSESKIASEAKGVDTVVALIAETRFVMGSVDSVFLHSTDGPLQKGSAFKMLAPEDSLEQEDGSYSRMDISGPPTSGKEKVEMNDPKSVISETAVVKKTFTSSSENMSASSIQLSEVAGKGVSDGSAAADKVTGFTSQVSLPTSRQCQLPLAPTMPSSLPLEEPLPSSERNAVPIFNFGSKNTPLVFSSNVITCSDPASQKFGARSDFKSQFFESSSTTTTTTAPGECTESNEAEKTQKAGYLPKSVGTSNSFGLSTSPTPSSFQFVASATSSQSNGSLTSTSSIFSVSSASAAFLSGGSSGSSSAIASMGPATVSGSSSGPSFQFGASSSSPALSALPSFQFGASSSAVFTDSALPVVKMVSTGLEPEVIKYSPFGNASSSAAVSSIFSSTGSSIFGFSASTLSSATTLFSSAGPAFGSQAAPSGSGTSFAETTASQFGSTASSTFGLAGSSLGFSCSAFGSSISSLKQFHSSSGFGPSSTLLSPGAACSSTPSSSSFAPTVTNPTTTSFGSSSMSPFSVSSSAAATPSVFSFTQAATTSSSAFSFTYGDTTISAPLSPAVSGFSGNDQMNVESMADDLVQVPVPDIPTFGQPSNGPTPSLLFGSTPPHSGPPVFQFASSQPSTFAPSQSPFQVTGSFEFDGNFSMGTGGGDKAGRRFVKAKRDKHRKK